MAKATAKVKTAGANMPVPQDDSEAREAIRELGDLKRGVLRLEAEMNDQIAALQQQYGESVAPLLAATQVKIEGLRIFAEANRDRLTGGGKVKFHRFSTGEISWRLRPAKVNQSGAMAEEAEARGRLRPEYPVAFSQPLALAALRIKATHQLNGQLDNFNALVACRCLDWDHTAGIWVVRTTSNPAALYRYALQSPANPKRVPDSKVDLDLLQDWHDFCRIKGLTYNRVLDSTDSTLRDVLTEVAAAGRASPRHDGLRWGVTIDRPSSLVVDHITPRNSWNARCRRSYFEPPHALRVKFFDAENDYKEAQRLIRWPGYDGPIDLTEQYDMPGKTDAAEVWREARRRQYEIIYRPDSYEVTQDGLARVATRGDMVMLQTDFLDHVQRAARVRAVTGDTLALDESVEMETGGTYAVRFRKFADADDTIGVSVHRTVSFEAGEHNILTLSGPGDMPGAGDIVMFGTAGSEAIPAMVAGVEAGQDFSSIVRLVDDAPIIDSLLAADAIPTWSGRVGAEIDDDAEPSAPRFVSVVSGVEGAGADGEISYLIAPGSGTVSTETFRIEHRAGTSGAWTAVSIPAVNGGGTIDVYANGQTVQLRALGESGAGIDGPYSATITFVVGAGDAPIPAALDAEAITVTTLLGGALIQISTGSDAETTQVQVYRSTASVLDRETDAVGAPIATAPLQSYSIALGDTSRSPVIINGSLSDAAGWITDASWTIGSGVAGHTPGTADALSQMITTGTAKWYRIATAVSGRTDGSILPVLAGGSDRLGIAIATDGYHLDRIQAVSGNDRVEWRASSTFDGSIDDLVVYLETAACLAQGAHYVWIEPQNADGVPGPVIGPITLSII